MTFEEYRKLVHSLFARRWVRYVFVGGLSAFCYILLGLLLVSCWGWPMLLGNALAYAASFLVAYWGQRRWTFDIAQAPHGPMLRRFAGVQVFGLVFNALLVLPLIHAGLPYGLAMLLASVLVPVAVYLLCRFWVFRTVDPLASRETDPRFLPRPGTGDVLWQQPCSNPPAVSVIMNCYNSSVKLEEALRSLAAQTFTDFEVIFWDNCSTDESPLIAQAFAPLRGRLRYFRGEVNVPLGAARNLALREAKGRYLAFLDCDDLWRPEKLAEQVDIFEVDPQVGLVCTDTEIFDGRRVLKRLFRQSRPVDGMVFRELMQHQWISMSSAMLRRSALESLAPLPADGTPPPWFDESLNVCEEADVFYRVAHDWKLAHVDRPLTLWRVHGGNTTFRKFGQFADETLRILDKHCQLYPGYEKEYADIVAMLRQRAAFQQAIALWRDGRGREARALLAPVRSASPKLWLFRLVSHLPGRCFDATARLYFALPAFLRR